MNNINTSGNETRPERDGLYIYHDIDMSVEHVYTCHGATCG